MWRTGSKFVCPSPAAIRRELPSSSRAGADPSLQDWLRPHHKRPPGRRAGSPVPGSPAEPAEAGAALGERNTDRKWIPRTLFATKREFNVNTTHATTGATALLLPAQRIRIRTRLHNTQQSTPPESCRLDVCIHVTRSGRWPSCRILPIQSVDHGREGGRGRIPPSSATPKGTAPETSRRRGEAAAAVAQGAALHWRRLAWLCRSRRLAGRP